MLIPEALELLGLEQRATVSEIKSAYRDQVKRWHPDQFGGDPERAREAEARARDINRAYEILQGYHSGPDVTHWNGGAGSDVKPLSIGNSPVSSVSRRTGRSVQSRLIRAAWVSAAVIAISAIGFALNRFVADEDDLSFAAASAPAPSPIKMPSVSLPADEPTPAAMTAVKPKDPAVPITTAPAAPVVSAPAIAPVKTPPIAARVTAPPVSAATTVRPRVLPARAGAHTPTQFVPGGIRRFTVVAPRSPSDPDVPDLALGDRLAIRTTCLNEDPAGGEAAYRECYLRKLEEHPKPIRLEPDPENL